MKVVRYPSNLDLKKSSLILGAFEVIHNGHLELIKRARKYKDPIVIMIIEDPSLLPKSRLKPATNLSVRLAQLANLNVDYAIVVPVQEKLILTNGFDFVTKMIRLCAAKRLIVGKDFKVGHRASYRAQAIKKDFPTTVIVDYFKFNNVKVSSRIIKELLATGAVADIKAISPFPFQREVSFNERYEAKDTTYLAIHPGIYACYCEINSMIYWALLHINIKHKMIIYAPDLNVNEQSFQAKVWFHRKVRAIIKASHDRVTVSDKNIVANYLNSL